MKPKPKYWAVTGRIPGDDEDSVYLCETTSRAVAVRHFDRSIWDDVSTPESYRADRARCRKQYGDTTYINSVMSSDTPITIE